MFSHCFIGLYGLLTASSRVLIYGGGIGKITTVGNLLVHLLIFGILSYGLLLEMYQRLQVFL